jgi:hypothetical protein
MNSRYSGVERGDARRARPCRPRHPLRDGIDRVVRSKAGALLVLSDDADVLSICSGGFLVDAPYSPQRLSELAKMDGAIIISTDGGRIARANVHLVPDPTVPTSETGTRHRTAERVARSLDVPVISASEEMGVINVYAGGTQAPAPGGRPPARPCQPGAADPRALQGPPRRRHRQPDRRRGRGRRDGARRRERRAAWRDGAPHRRRDRDDDHRARRRRPPAAAAARRAVRRDRRRARPGGRRLPPAAPQRRRHARGDVAAADDDVLEPAPRRRRAGARLGDSTDLGQEARRRVCACCTGSAGSRPRLRWRSPTTSAARQAAAGDRSTT